jgi:3-vinyl bacteriochlorophyllide hydratase
MRNPASKISGSGTFMSYTPEQLKRRQNSRWTRVQMITAPVQFLTFVVSVVLVWRYLASGEGYAVAHLASLLKVALMIFITVTGMLWEKDVYGKYFLAPEFFWEDLVNGISLLFHLAFLAALALGAPERVSMAVMAIALATYVVNFVQFAWRGAQSARQRRRPESYSG